MKNFLAQFGMVCSADKSLYYAIGDTRERNRAHISVYIPRKEICAASDKPPNVCGQTLYVHLPAQRLAVLVRLLLTEK